MIIKNGTNLFTSPGSYGKSTAKSTALETEGSDEYQARWVFFPMLVESCGVISRRIKQAADPELVIPEACVDETEHADDQCTLTPHKDSDGNAAVFWAVRKSTPPFSPRETSKMSSSLTIGF
jgi:hypothetical protein